VAESTVLQGQPARQILAYLWMHSHPMRDIYGRGEFPIEGLCNETFCLDRSGDGESDVMNSGTNVTLLQGYQLGDTGLYTRKETPDGIININIPDRMKLTPIDQERWNFAGPVFKIAWGKDRSFKPERDLTRCTNPKRQPNWRWPRPSDSFRQRAWFVFVVTGLLYGGLHLAPGMLRSATVPNSFYGRFPRLWLPVMVFSSHWFTLLWKVREDFAIVFGRMSTGQNLKELIALNMCIACPMEPR
jgi:hypothetical protein